MTQQATNIGLFWSGALGRRAAELHAALLREVFPGTPVFISTETAPGVAWFDIIRAEISQAAVGLFFLSPDALESRWLSYECGQLAATRELEAIIPVRIGVSQKLADARLPVLQPHNASNFGTKAAFTALCTTCAIQLEDARAAHQIAAAATQAWQQHQDEIAALDLAAQRTIPNEYFGAARYAASIGSTNFNMPGVFSAFESELFLVGINHSHVLNVANDPRVLLALVDRLLAPGSKGRARFLISDMWNPSVLECYSRLVHAGIASAALAAFTKSYKAPADPAFIANVITRERGAAALDRIVGENLLEIRAYATILDTFWLIDGATSRGRCQLALANASDGPGRPVFFCGADDQPEIFSYYYNLANTAYSLAEPIWPQPSTA